MATKSGIPRSTLDKATAARIEALPVAGADNLTDGDKVFLAARKDYLSEAEREDLGVDADVEAGADDGDTPTHEEVEDPEMEDDEEAEEKPKPKKAAAKKKK